MRNLTHVLCVVLAGITLPVAMVAVAVIEILEGIYNAMCRP